MKVSIATISKRVSLVAAMGFLSAASAVAADLGVTARKLVLIDKIDAAQKLKLVYVSKLDNGIDKGPAGDPALLSGSFRWFYTDDPGGNPDATLNIENDPPAQWVTNTSTVAKFVHRSAATGLPTPTKIAVVKPQKLAKVVALGFGDEGFAFLAGAGAPSDAGGITTVLTIHNGSDGSTHRMCTKFAVSSGSTILFKELPTGLDRKLVARGGVPTTCPPGSPSGAFVDGADER